MPMPLTACPAASSLYEARRTRQPIEPFTDATRTLAWPTATRCSST